MILANFPAEEKIWYGIPEFNVLARNISVPGISQLYTDVHCTADWSGSAATEVNAATSMSALVYSPMFDLTQTYFMIASCASISPEVGTLNSVIFSRYVVQIALQYEFDIRDLPDNYTTGYIPLGSKTPDEYPPIAYGTEVFELNTALRGLAMGIASRVELGDSDISKAYRAHFASAPRYEAATKPPSVFAGDCVEGTTSGRGAGWARPSATI